MKIYAIVTATADPTTLADVSAWLESLANLGQPDSLTLLDGAQLYPAGHPHLTPLTFFPDPVGITLADVATWLATMYKRSSASTTLVEDAQDLAVDLITDEITTTGCGVCALRDVIVNVHTH